MKVGAASQTFSVVETAPTVELTSATISAQVNATTVRELPLNGRDWTQLATLEPGIATVKMQASTSSPSTNRANRGFGNQLTDSGHSPYENNYRVNGISINDYTNGSPGSAIGANLGTDAIQEFS
jgi:peptidoglycan hydrolase-like amidase